jgi:ATP-dependent helicase HrpA
MARRRSTRDPQRRRADAEHRTAARATAHAALLTAGRLTSPPELPISARRDELIEAIRAHQVVIVAGETGSGKSTQLPKLCLAAGRGISGMIGHTQPRRVAARTIAERIASELGSPLGTDVGYAVRFTDTVGDSTMVKVMTDGILLAEIRRDRMLRRYDTIIVDEAHERSLNIDFILGYLAQLLPRRPDLSVIVTSATIDTDRFASHFATGGTDAPVIEVTGRTYPVEVRYRPLEGRPGDGAAVRDQVTGIVDAVRELSAEGPGDVLVFVAGEREIHDAADALRAERLAGTEVLPLYARLPVAEQQRIFQPHTGRRVVLATNVAETSLTVPGVRYVIDAGTARISRYSRRLKVQRLPIEAVSQASANQRAGRCGRVGPGICIRLYAEDDFDGRPEFTEPEILRTNLASVILQMISIGLGDLSTFPFVEAPDRRMIRDGYALLDELGALEPGDDDAGRRLTPVGRRLATLPIDPRLGRMILEADRFGCVREVLVIASALSMQDVRERPADRRDQAAQSHARFRVDGSDLLGLVALWDHLRTAQRQLSGNQFRRTCRAEFLNYVRVREWMDLYSQLRRAAGDLGIRVGTDHPPEDDDTVGTHPEHVHRAVLAGLLSHVGVRDRETRAFRGARDSRFVIAPGSALSRRPPEWVMAAELVETSQLYARRVAAIDPRWVEDAGAHLVKRSYGDVRWDARAGRAVTSESVSLYGLPVVSGRLVGVERFDVGEARAWFISKALIAGEVPPGWSERHEFVARNADFLAAVDRVAARVRRIEVVDDEMLYDFFDERVDADVTSTSTFDRWWKDTRRSSPGLLDLTDDLFAGRGGHGSLRLADFPDVWTQSAGRGAIELPLTYRYAPGEPLDGVTVHVVLSALNQVADDGFDWQIRGHRSELVEVLLRSLPKRIRRELIPFGDTLDRVSQRLPVDPMPGRRLVDVLADAVTAVAGQPVRSTDFDIDAVPAHLRIHFVITDDAGDVVDVGTDLTAIKDRLAGEARASIARAAPIVERRGITTWDMGDLPQVVEGVADGGLGVMAYPALLDVGDSVSLRVVSNPELQQRVMRGGVRRLLVLDAAPSANQVERLVDRRDLLGLASASIGRGALVAECAEAAVDEVMGRRAVPWTEQGYGSLRAEVKRDAPSIAAVAYEIAVRIVLASSDVERRLAALTAPAARATVADVNAHLGRLVRPGFVLAAGVERLPDIERYVSGIAYRLDHLAGSIDRDRRTMAEIVALEERFASIVDGSRAGALPPALIEVRWQLEDLRLASFAQPLVPRRAGRVSATRIRAALDAAAP